MMVLGGKDINENKKTVKTIHNEEEVNLLKKLMNRFIHDIKRGLSSSEAGWVNEEYKASGLLHMFIEKKDGNIRILPREELTRIFKFSEKEGIWLANLCLDIAKVSEVRDLLVKITGEFDGSPQLQGSVLLLGLRKMLRNVNACVAVDRILEMGFNVVRWNIEAPKASTNLALSVIRKWWDVKLDDVKQLSEKLNLEFTWLSDSEAVRKIECILNWDAVVSEFGKTEAEALGLLWFADVLAVSKGISLPDAFVLIKEKTWELVSRRMAINEIEVMRMIRETVSKLSDNSRCLGIVTINWTEIICPPW